MIETKTFFSFDSKEKIKVSMELFLEKNTLKWEIKKEDLKNKMIHFPEKKGFQDFLWEFDVCELFLVSPSGFYFEYEINSHLDFLALEFESYRKRIGFIEHQMLPFEEEDIFGAFIPKPLDEDGEWRCQFCLSFRDLGYFIYPSITTLKEEKADFHRIARQKDGFSFYWS